MTIWITTAQNQNQFKAHGGLSSLVALLGSSNPKLASTAAWVCSVLTQSEQFKRDIVEANGMGPLTDLLTSSDMDTVDKALRCMVNIANYPPNRQTFMEKGTLKRLLDLLNRDEDIQILSLMTLINITLDGTCCPTLQLVS